MKDDLAINSRIASIIIKGGVFGTPGITSDSFGFVAQEIVSFKVGTTVIPLKPVWPMTFRHWQRPAHRCGPQQRDADSFEVHVLKV